MSRCVACYRAPFPQGRCGSGGGAPRLSEVGKAYTVWGMEGFSMVRDPRRLPMRLCVSQSDGSVFRSLVGPRARPVPFSGCLVAIGSQDSSSAASRIKPPGVCVGWNNEARIRVSRCQPCRPNRGPAFLARNAEASGDFG